MIGKQQYIAGQFIFQLKLAKNGNKRRYAGASGYKQSRTAVIYRAEDFMNDQFVPRLNIQQLFGNAIMAFVNFYCEFEVIVAIKAGERKRPQLVFEARLVNGNISSLPGYKSIPGRLFQRKAFYVVCNKLGF